MRTPRATIGLRLTIVLLALVMPAVVALAQPQIEITPAPIDFGGVPVDSCASRRVVVRNLTADTVIVDSIGIVGSAPSPFAVVHPALPLSIPGLQETELTIDFCPFDTLRQTASLVVLLRNRGGALDTSVAVSGIGVGGPLPVTEARIEVDPLVLEFDTVEVGTCIERSFRITNRGTAVLTIATSYIVPSGAPFHILDTAGSGGVLPVLAMSIAPDSTRTVRIRFCPDSLGSHAAIDTIISNASEGNVRVVLRGVGIATRPVWSGPRHHDFGTVDLGASSDATLEFVNTSGTAHAVTPIVVGAVAVSQGFEARGTVPSVGAVVLPGDTLLVRLRFTPRAVAVVVDSVVAQSQSQSPIGITLAGMGRSVAEGHAVALEPTSGRVGEPLELRVLISPPLSSADDVHDATIRLRMDPRSFEALASPGWRIDERATGAVTYVRTAIGAITGETVATLRLRPLSTAQPVDTVTLDSIDLSVERLYVSAPRATIALEGCDLGRDLGLSRPLSVRSMSRNERDAIVALEYQAPSGSTPTLAVFDRSGAIVERLTLPPGTGEPQRFDLALDACPPGLLIVELTVERQRLAIPIMHRP